MKKHDRLGPTRVGILGAFAIAAAAVLAAPQAYAANIISFDDNATGCGGAVLCATDGNATTGGTHGYNGTNPFSFTTINAWFQVDSPTSNIAGQPAQPANAGDFLVVNNTGALLRHDADDNRHLCDRGPVGPRLYRPPNREYLR